MNGIWQAVRQRLGRQGKSDVAAASRPSPPQRIFEETGRHSDVAAFLSEPSLQDGLHVIEGSNPTAPLSLHLRILPDRPLFIFFNANVPRDHVPRMPAFAGMGILGPAPPFSRICICDPTLYMDDTLTLGWYAGNRDRDIPAEISLCLRHLVTLCRPSKVIFVGGSCAGFAALRHAPEFPDSLSIIWNPQTDLRRYNETKICHYVSTAFAPVPDMAAAIDVLNWKTAPSIIGLYRPEPQNAVIYLQNRSDGHTDRHLIPFLTGIARPYDLEARDAQIRGKIAVIIGDWGQGHVPPSKSAISDLLSLAVSEPEFPALAAKIAARLQQDAIS